MQKEDLYSLLKNPQEIKSFSTPELKSVVEEYPFFQLAQIIYLKHLKETFNSEFDSVLKKVAIQVPNRKQLYRFLNSKNPVKNIPEFDYQKERISSFKLEYDTELNQEDSLIDKFLSSNPGTINISGNKKDKPQSIDNEFLNNSEKENDEIITETLAMIYFQQKKYNKALDAFHKLSLKYPEKSVYFATRIEEIEKLKNI